MKSFGEFLNENIHYYSDYSVNEFVKIAKAKVQPIFSILQPEDEEMRDNVSIFYNGVEDYFIISEKIEEKYFQTWHFDLDEIKKSYVSYKTESFLVAYNIAKVLTIFNAKNEQISHQPLMEKIVNFLLESSSMFYNSGTKLQLEDLYDKFFKKMVKDYEEDYEEKVEPEILRKLGAPPHVHGSRTYGLT